MTSLPCCLAGAVLLIRLSRPLRLVLYPPSRFCFAAEAAPRQRAPHSSNDSGVSIGRRPSSHESTGEARAALTGASSCSFPLGSGFLGLGWLSRHQSNPGEMLAKKLTQENETGFKDGLMCRTLDPDIPLVRSDSGKDVALLPNECIWQIPQQLLQQEVGRCEAHSRQVR
eukprot:scaffold1954_cov268-Pinguiococcus_pyrenoidosus.AAC.40